MNLQSMNIKWSDAALLLAAAFLLGWLISHSSQSPNTMMEKELIKTRIDTVLSIVEVPIRPILLHSEKNATKTVVLHDTVYREACLDTLLTSDTAAIAPDTLSVCYARDLFSVALGLSPRRQNIKVPYLAHDTFFWRDNENEFREGKQPWYDLALGVLIALAAGIVIGKL
jgi:hypothetical protein